MEINSLKKLKKVNLPQQIS